jgi:hypothetical protein
VPLAVSLLECAERCERVLRTYFETADVAPDTDFERAMIFCDCCDARRDCAGGRLRGRRVVALRLVVDMAGRAREVLRGEGSDREMVCADDCDRAAKLSAEARAFGDRWG